LLDAGRRLLAYLGVFAMCAALITSAAVFPNLAISHLRWEVPFICASVVGAWVVAQSLSATQVAPGISFASWRIAAAVAVIVVNSFLLVRATISNLSVSGGWGQLSGYSELERLRDANSPIRVVSMPYSSPSAAIAPVLGVDAFDGMSAGFSVRRTMFFQQLLQADPNRPVHTHRQGLAASAAPELIQALRIANVGAILSTSLEDVDDLPVSFEIHGRSLQLPAAGDAIYPVLGIDGGAIHVVPTLRVWRIADPWQRWFIAKSAVASRYPLRNPEYWRELLRQPIDSALFAVDEVPAATGFMRSDPAAVLVSGSKTANGFALQTNGLQSVVVINQVFDDFWNAQCDRKPLPVFPVNGIMFAVFAPDGCRELSITRRP
jgi:hypothetical protein